MATARVESSPLIVAALGYVGDGASAEDLEVRFAADGVGLAEGRAAELLSDLASLGLVRVARGGTNPDYVPTSLGRRLLDRGDWTDAAAQLRDLERMRTDFLSIIAHELRTPITVMRTLTGLLLDPASRPSEEQHRTMLETMERNAERMQDLIEEILDVARYRSGTIRLQLRRFDARLIAESAAATIRPLAERRNQDVELRLPAGRGPSVYGDRSRLDRALLNLASNAQRFAPDGGHVTIALEPERDGTIRWSVTDDGPGISEDDQAHLFERFFVGQHDPDKAEAGVGLGLPGALAIAQAHGGTIEVDSRLGEGSTFRLVVPAGGPAPAAEDA
ncbi:MAG TPA: HAMP domain-containing sensor histidine kinase [Candidatus Limnocylindrales bacterium]|nr:HAMP domain-containing sensor histidine kinase [Candidatus Limnocylindrales bacterium]